MRYVLWPTYLAVPSNDAVVQRLEIDLGGYFYDYLRNADGSIVGIRYWLLEGQSSGIQIVFSQFRADSRFLFSLTEGFVDFVFEERDATLLRNAELSIDVAQDFGGECILGYSNHYGIEFYLPHSHKEAP